MIYTVDGLGGILKACCAVKNDVHLRGKHITEIMDKQCLIISTC